MRPKCLVPQVSVLAAEPTARVKQNNEGIPAALGNPQVSAKRGGTSSVANHTFGKSPRQFLVLAFIYVSISCRQSFISLHLFATQLTGTLSSRFFYQDLERRFSFSCKNGACGFVQPDGKLQRPRQKRYTADTEDVFTFFLRHDRSRGCSVH